jgi:DNA polymerase
MNFFNIPKGDDDGLTHGVDLRGMLIPRQGKKFIIYDYSSIEPRVTQWIAGGTEFLALVAKENIYQATAKSMGWFPLNEDGLKYTNKKLYQLAKACTLGMSYRMGAGKFLLSCKKMRASLDPVPPAQWNLDRRMKFILTNVEEINWKDPANADYISAYIASDNVVREWRQKNPKVVNLWLALENEMKTAAQNGQTEYTFRLPSGRAKTYYNVAMRTVPKVMIDPEDPKKREQRFETQLFASTMKGSKPIAIHGGVLTEHLVQSISRDIMFQGARDVWKAYPRWTYIGNVYDEVVFEVPDKEAELADRVIPDLLCNGTARSWMGDLPLAVEGGVKDKYEK